MYLMGRWGLLMGAVLLLGCATKRAAAQAPNNEPPPRGAPQPRLGYIPPPAPARASETVDENERRFPILEHQQRKEREQRAKMKAAGRVEVKPGNPTQACEGLSAEEKIECPLHDPKAVLSIADLPSGARISLRPGAANPEKLQQMFACHKGLAAARPQAPTACSFFDARSEAEVAVRDGHVDVDIERSGDVDRLRRSVRTALAPRSSH